MASIDSLSPTIRDDLLKRNLILPDIIENNSLGGRAGGLGKQASIGGNAPSVQQGTRKTKTFREAILGLNTYEVNQEEEVDINLEDPENHGNINGSAGKSYNGPSDDDDRNIQQLAKNERNDLTTLNPYQPTNDFRTINISNKNLEELGNLEDDERPRQYNGPDIDIRGMVASRTLTPEVQGDDTLIGQLADDYRQNNLLASFQTNAQEESIGRINTNPLSILQGNSLITPNYSITVPKGKLGKVGDFGLRVLGFEVPVSLMDSSSSIFYSENPVSNIKRANSMLDNSGEGQVIALINNMNQNQYKPLYEDDRIQQGVVQAEKGTNPELYAFGSSDGDVIDLLNTNENDRISFSYDNEFNSEFDDLIDVNKKFETSIPSENESKFVWTDSNNNNVSGDDIPFIPQNRFSKGILKKTRTLFETGRMKTLTAGKGVKNVQNDEISTPASIELGSSNYLSKGSAIQSRDALKGAAREPNNVFCRVWTTFDQYSQVEDLQKHEGLNKQAGFERDESGINNSVLDDNGFARIAPRKNQEDVKDYMLSIENLAWSDEFSKLPKHERGPGDPVTGTKGRIMWFPPYDISITDNSTANWTTSEFIGRGEPVYTYNNTERNMTLGFKVIIDYPSYLEQIKGGDFGDFDSKYTSAFAGCYDIEDFPEQLLSGEEQEEVKKGEDAQKDQPAEDDKTIGDKLQFVVRFANDQAQLPPSWYEDGDSSNDDSTTQDGMYESENKQKTPNRTDYGLNRTWFDIKNNRLDELKQYFSDEGECNTCKIKIKGTANSQGGGVNSEGNKNLAQDRADNLKKWFIDNILPDEDEIEKRFEIETNVEEVGEDIDPDSIQAKTTRFAEATYQHDSDLSEDVEGAKRNKSESDDDQDTKKVPSKDLRKRLLTEKDFFERMKEEDSFLYNTINKKIKYFHPSFHSTTPEGFNARLNFLHQCMRQGPTHSSGEGNSRRPNNLAFGRPPVCILRVGDFYYTKIVIDNLNIDFEPLVWDLNPEGVGVQPMIANVHLSFKAVGGSSLKGPINMLQNAVSFNFFANTHIYDPRAHRVVNDDNVETEASYNDVPDDQSKPSEQDGIGNNDDTEGNQTSDNEEAGGEGGEDEIEENGILELLKHSSVTYDRENSRLNIRLGKQDKTYNLENSTIKVTSKPLELAEDGTFPGFEEKELDKVINVDGGQVDGPIPNKGFNVLLSKVHPKAFRTDIDSREYRITLDAGNGNKIHSIVEETFN